MELRPHGRLLKANSMPSKILACTKGTDGYKLTVHLDLTKVDEDTGEPQAEYVKEWTWGLPQRSEKPLHPKGGHEESGAFHHAAHTQHGKDLTEKQYLEGIFALLPEMVELELHRIEGTSHHDQHRQIVKTLHGKVID